VGKSEHQAGSLGYRPSLDGLRGLAILVVVAYNLHWGLPGGYLGVDLFFVLSGFLITSLLLEEYRRNNRIDFRSFYMRRALRLLPALMFMLALLCLGSLILHSREQAEENFLASLIALFYFGNWVLAAGGFHILGTLAHTWSLAVEEQFYMAWPPVLAVLLNLQRPRRILGCLGLAIVMSALWRLQLSLSGAPPYRMYAGTDTRADALLLGCLLSFLLYRTKARSWSCFKARFGVTACAVFMAVTLFLPPDSAYFMTCGGFTAVAVTASLLLGHIVVYPDGILSRGFSFRPLVILGKVSYGLYLWHVVLGHFVDSGRTGLDGFALATLQGVVIAAAVAFSWFFIEQPALRLKKRWSRVETAGKVLDCKTDSI